MIYKNRYLLVLITSFVISSCGGGGASAGPLAPIINSLSSSSSSIEIGETITLNWSSENSTSCTASGNWQGIKLGTGSEIITISTVGNNIFTLTCNGNGGTSSPASISIDGYRVIRGVAVDGYISNAEIFIDLNENHTLDSDENSVVADNNGSYAIRHTNGTLISLGGTDLDTQVNLVDLNLIHSYEGHSPIKVISPVTSVAAFLDGTISVNTALGIDPDIDIKSFDPVANKGDGGVNDYLYEKGNQLTTLVLALNNITKSLNTTNSTLDHFKIISEEIDKAYDSTKTKIDIEAESFITSVLDNSITANNLTTLSDTNKQNVITALKGVMPIIQIKSSTDNTTSINRFAFSTFQTDISSLADGTATDAIVSSYNSNILSYIATDQGLLDSDIAPSITATADSLSLNEDTTVTINVLANDSYITTAPITVTTSNGDKGTTSVSGGVISYVPNTNANGDDSFTYTINQAGKTSTATVAVSISPVNDAPVINIASTLQIAENSTALGSVSISDVDDDDMTLTITGTDASSFSLSTSNSLSFKTAPDYETKTAYYLTLSVTDGQVTVTKDITISVTNLNDNSPVISSSATQSVSEFSKTIGSVTSTDADGDSLTYSLSGTSASFVNLSSSGVLSLKSDADYEARTSYSIIVTVSDGTNSTSQTITINVINNTFDDISIPDKLNLVETQEEAE